MTGHICHDCKEPIEVYIASWSNERWGLFLCVECAGKRHQLGHRARVKGLEAQWHNLQDYPPLANHIESQLEKELGKGGA